MTTVLHACNWGAEDEYGECYVTRYRDPIDPLGRSVLLIEQADPRSRITPELLTEIRSQDPELARLAWVPGCSVTLTCPHEKDTSPCPTGDVLRIDARERSVIYRIGQHLPENGCYEIEWPD